MTKNRISFLNILDILVRWRRFIITWFFISSIVALVISLMLPKWYRSQTVVLPPEKEGLNLALGPAAQVAGSFLGGGGGFELPMFATPSDVYQTILESRSVAESVIIKFDLKNLYKSKNMDLAIEEFEAHRKVEIGREGTIFINFEAKNDPQLAADVANELVMQLDTINRQKRTTRARLAREFIERRLDQAKNELAQAEESLREFQETHSTISLENQVKAAIEGAAELIAELKASEIKLGVMERSMSSSHSQIKELKWQVEEIRQQLDDLKYGSGSIDRKTATSDSVDFYIPLANVPEVGLQYARLFRAVKIQEILYELLVQQYEQERIKEAKDTPTIQVLDKAIPAEKKSRPKRAIVVLIAAMFSLFVTISIAFIVERLREIQRQNSAEYHMLKSIVGELKSDFRFLKKKKNRASLPPG